MRSSTPQALTCLLDKKAGFTYEYFHGPARSQGLAETHPGGSEDSDMSGVVKNITYGELWSNKNAKKAHGEPAARRVWREHGSSLAFSATVPRCHLSQFFSSHSPSTIAII